MKPYLTLLFLFFNFCGWSQLVKVQGTAHDNFRKNGRVKIVVNDTIAKVSDSQLRLNLYNNPNLVTRSNEDGSFEIFANLDDSLYFSKHFFQQQVFKVADLIREKSISIALEESPCREYIPCNEEPTDLKVFIGKKISVNFSNELRYCGHFAIGDAKYISSYFIEQPLYGNFKGDTITFSSYIHSTRIEFYEFSDIILWVERYCNEEIQKKYQFYPVYKTKNGKWVMPALSIYDNITKISRKKPHKVRMAEPIMISKNIPEKDLESVYKKPYFKIKKGKVYLSLAYYPEEIIVTH